MAAQKEIIKEFLVSLGFHVQPISFRRFAEALKISDHMSLKTGAAILGVAAAAEALTIAFARSMEKMYYASRRNKSTVESLQAIRYGAQQVGVEAETMGGILESFSGILRTSPGSRAVLEQILGTPTENKENVELLYGLVAKLKGMPHEIGSQWASMFGIDEPTFFMLKDRLDELMAADAKRRRMNREAGVNPEDAAAASREYMNTLRDLWKRVELFGDRLAIDLLPKFKEFAKDIESILTFLTKLDYKGMDKLLDSVDKQAEKWGLWGDKVKIVTDSIRNFTEMFGMESMGRAWAMIMGGPNWERGGRREPLITPQSAPYLNRLDKQSNRQSGGDSLSSALISLGMLHREYESEMTGDQMSAIEREMSRTQGIIDRLRTQGFVPSGPNAPAALAYDQEMTDRKAGVVINQHTEITVNSSDPLSAGRSTAAAQGRVNGDLVRNAAGAIR